MPKLDGMNPGPVRRLLAELRQAAKEMRSVDARVTQLLSNAGLSAKTTYRPSQVADDVDKMIRDVEARLALLEKEEKQKKPSVTTPDAMGEKKPADDPGAKPEDSAKSKGKGDAERRGPGESAAGDGKGESSGKGEAERRGSGGDAAGGKGESGESGGKGEAERRGSGEGAAGGKGESGESGGKGEAERRGSGGDAAGGKGESGESGGKGEAERRGSGEGAAGGKGGCEPDGAKPDAAGDARTDKGGDRADAGKGAGGDAIADTDGKDHPDDIPASRGLRVIEVDGVKVVTGSLQPPSEAYLRWLEQNMDRIQPFGMPGAEDGRLGASDGGGPRADGAAGRMEPTTPGAGTAGDPAGAAGTDGAGGRAEAPSDASRYPITDREVAGVESAGSQGVERGGAVSTEDAFARGDVSIVNRDGISLMPYLEGSGSGDGAAGTDANGRQERAEPVGGARAGDGAATARYGEPYPAVRGAALGQESGGPFASRDGVTLMPYVDAPATADGAAGTETGARQGQDEPGGRASAGARTDGTGTGGAGAAGDGRADGGGRCDDGERPGRSMGT
ncbi:hypothetical protein GCM10010106_35890 [Thermopolyspora flexuosa]|uniref:hypothetical protein n=1 Tax=Thermopolyspora flexuosa TaxID=103836 RepID=UPI00166F2ACA|nr:hypothetical protein [Thermopolyspora flexuosa]GGM85681.1 hypothetical protein GCM10010106_35890 [Thermopolyspora flexuosa]